MSIFGKNTPPENENYEQKKLEMAQEMCDKIKTQNDTIVLTKRDFFEKCGDACVKSTIHLMKTLGMPEVISAKVMSTFSANLIAELFGKVDE